MTMSLQERIRRIAGAGRRMAEARAMAETTESDDVRQDSLAECDLEAAALQGLIATPEGQAALAALAEFAEGVRA